MGLNQRSTTYSVVRAINDGSVHQQSFLWPTIFGDIVSICGCIVCRAKVRNEKPRDKPFKPTDGGRLFLFVSPSGGNLWRFRYQFEGNEKLLSIGPYPAISLSDAGAARDGAKAALRDHCDPGVAKKLRKLTPATSSEKNFEAIAYEWLELSKSQWVAKHADDVIGSLEKEIFPHLGQVPIKDVTVPDVLNVLRLIEKRPAIETARRVRRRMSSLKKGRQLAITDLAAARTVLQKADDETALIASPLYRRTV